MLRQVNETDRKYFHTFIEECPQYRRLYDEWYVAVLLAEHEKEYELAVKLFNKMLTEGWG